MYSAFSTFGLGGGEKQVGGGGGGWIFDREAMIDNS